MKNKLIIINKDAKVLLSKVHNQIEITKGILKQKNRIWEQKLLEWGQQHIIQDSAIFPKTYDDMLKSIKINLRWNRLNYIPVELCHMKQLQILELNNNNLDSLPIVTPRKTAQCIIQKY